jgi:hypothetical protein
MLIVKPDETREYSMCYKYRIFSVTAGGAYSCRWAIKCSVCPLLPWRVLRLRAAGTDATYVVADSR